MSSLSLDYHKGRVSACNDICDEIDDMIKGADDCLVPEVTVLQSVQRRVRTYTDIEVALKDRAAKREATK